MAQATFDIPKPIQADLTSYFAHILHGMPIREIARKTGCHPSTVLRRVRRLENRRDDPLLDAALACVEESLGPRISQLKQKGQIMKFDASLREVQVFGAQTDEVKRVLRRLCETDAVLVVSPEMPKGVILREVSKGAPIRTAVVDRELAMSLALKDWVQVKKQGRVTRYGVTQAGRQALKRMLVDEDTTGDGFAEQHRSWGTREELSEIGTETRTLRVNLAESPLSLLARRKDKSGERFLSDALVTAGERLREDFELAQMAPSVAQNWDRFLTGPGTGGTLSDGKGGGSTAARDRLQAALAELGPGLGDVALRCCCYLEGLETIEKRLGWAARSGKIVLRIALQRLKRHYDELHGPCGPMIG